MQWIKQGVIFEPPHLDWMVTHAMLPFVEELADHYRVYFSGRDEEGRARIGFFEIDMDQPQTILRVCDKPIVGLGALGTFDDHGVTVAWVVSHRNRKYLYYSGWSLGVTVPFYFYVGLAVSEDGGASFHRISSAPILERNEIDPYLTAAPCILIENNVWRMWYVSCSRWELENDQPKHYYHIRYAESSDGIRWDRRGIVCIDYQSPDEFAIARPCVIKDDDVYRMWYSYRGKSYRIGYAESKDGIRWERKDDQVGIDVSGSGWDSEMTEYSFVFDHNNERYMLYNGNGYGKTGIGLALLAPKSRDPIHKR